MMNIKIRRFALALLILVSCALAGCAPKPRNELHADPPFMVSQYIKLLAPAAIKFAQENERIVLQQGVPLNPYQRRIAARAGVKNLDKVRILYTNEFPQPKDPQLARAARRLAYTIPDMTAYSYGYGVRIRTDQKLNISLLAHEMVHVRQAEEMGLAAHTREYLLQVFIYGYYVAPLEEEAFEEARKYL